MEYMAGLMAPHLGAMAGSYIGNGLAGSQTERVANLKRRKLLSEEEKQELKKKILEKNLLKTGFSTAGTVAGSIIGDKITNLKGFGPGIEAGFGGLRGAAYGMNAGALATIKINSELEYLNYLKKVKQITDEEKQKIKSLERRAKLISRSLLAVGAGVGALHGYHTAKNRR